MNPPTAAPVLPPVESLSLADLRDEVAVLMGWRWFVNPHRGLMGLYHPDPELREMWAPSFEDVTDRLRDYERFSDYARHAPDYPRDIAAAMQVALQLHALRHAVCVEMSRFENFPLVKAWRLDTHPLGPGHSISSEIPSTKPERLPEAICRVAVQIARLEKGGAA